MRPLFLLLLAASFLAAAPLEAQRPSYDSLNATLGTLKKQMNDYRPRIGLKAGYNIARVQGSTTNYSPNNQNGFMVAAFYAPASRGMGYRTELVFSRQGFAFDESGKMQEVTQDYLYMPHFTTFTIARRVQLQAGGQVGYLLKAKKTSSSGSESAVQDYMNRIDYGFAGGVEVYPFKGLLLGARYNISFGNVYKQYEQGGSTSMPPGYPFPFTPNEVKGKNAVVQFFAGYRF